MEYLRRIEAVLPAQRPLVGEKAFRLSQLYRQGYPVVPGIVLDTTCCARVLAAACEGEPMLAALWQGADIAGEASKLQQQAAMACRAVRAIAVDEFVDALAPTLQDLSTAAVILRASLTFPGAERQPIPGLLGSRAVRRDRPAELAAALSELWAALLSARSLAYWRSIGLSLPALQLAVLVQPLLGAEIAGEARSTAGGWEILAVRGLGHSLVRGEVEPERWEIDLDGQPLVAREPAQPAHLRYRPADAPAALERIALNAEATAVPLFTDVRLAQLAPLLQQLALDTPQFELEWLWGCLSGDAAPQPYICQWFPVISPLAAPGKPALEAAAGGDRSSYLQGRAAAPGSAIAPAYVLSAGEHPPPGQILVARQIFPAQLSLLQESSGLILEEGGLNGHGAILARELGIPAVIGIPTATAVLQTGRTVAIDGDRGEVDLAPSSLPAAAAVPPTPTSGATLLGAPPRGTQLLVNLSQPAGATAAARLDVDGIGLLRADLLLLAASKQQPLAAWLQPEQQPQLVAWLAAALERILVAFAPRGVCYRACDWLGSPETRPWLGQRGTGRIQQNPTLFDLELAAIARLQQRGHRHLKLVLPFVRDVEEFQFCRRRVAAAGLAATEIWLMVEVPSALFLLPDYAAAGAKGIAIGTNDLTQLLLGSDRETAGFASRYEERHPAVLAAVCRAIAEARDLGLECSVCGQMVARFPETVDALVRWGVTALSVEPAAVPATARAIARAEQRLLLDSARRQLAGEQFNS